jgi:GTP-binding protein Era
MQTTPKHKAGFVSIVGKPNVGKSTLMNALIGEKLSIITSKAQTTRHRIMGILNGSSHDGDDFQIVYSDTPGILEPKYELQASMMKFVQTALSDADVILFVTDLEEKFAGEAVIEKLNQMEMPVIFVMNKIDLGKGSQAHDKLAYWKEIVKADAYIPVSALLGAEVNQVFEAILQYLPEHPPYYPKDEISDRPERFFAAEIVREKIFLNYQQEVPYSSEVVITEFKEEPDIIRMRCEIYVERESQKGIIIGKKGEALKTVGIQAREDMEKFFGKKVYLEQHVKVAPDWRKKQQQLNRFGYN